MNKKLFGVLAVLLATVFSYWLYTKPVNAPEQQHAGKRGPGDGRPLPVHATPAKRGDIDVLINALGTVTARNTVAVKARVDGQLVRIGFREGQTVKAGEVLAEIDPRPFQVQLDQANGQLLRDEALLANARLDLERYRGLLAKDSIAKQQVDAQESLVRQYEGTVKTDRALAENAQLQLGFTHITAPLAGRAGLRQIDVGNMIHGSDATGLVVITQTQPITVVFAIPADSIAAVIARLRAGELLDVMAFDRDGKTRLASGKLLTVDNQIDVTTGTVKLKAEFGNSDDKLFPNQFVNARLRVETKHDAILIPVSAIQRGTQGTFVYVVGQDQTVAMRPVTIGVISADNVAIDKGLVAGDQVITDGADKLRDGVSVEVTIAGANAPKEKGAQSIKSPGEGVGGASVDERQKRWAELNARIDRGEFGEDIKKLPEEERKQHMREMRSKRYGGASGSNDAQ